MKIMHGKNRKMEPSRIIHFTPQKGSSYQYKMKTNIVLLLLIFVCSNCYSQEKKSDPAQANNQFAFSLYKNVKEKNKNLLFSPFSISCAMSMVYAGAKNDTELEFQKVLFFGENDSVFHQNFGTLIKDIEKKSYYESETNMLISNSLWMQRDYNFVNSFVENAEKNYQAKIEKVDFINEKNRENARERINRRVGKDTKNKIDELIQRGVLKDITRLVLVNAIYLSSPWETKFPAQRIKKATFNNSNNSQKDVDFLDIILKVRYYKDKSLQMIELNFKGLDGSMIFILPDEFISAKKFEKQFTYENFNTWYSELKYENVNITIPKFRLENDFELSTVLQKIGMKKAFGNDADFSNLCQDNFLKINNVIHKTYIDLNQDGIEAAAATAVILERKSNIQITEFDHVFKADRPFIFLIKNSRSGTILFMGAVDNL